MRAVETLVAGLALPAPACLLGLVLAILAWLDDGEYRRPSRAASPDGYVVPKPGNRSNFPA